MGFGTLWGGLYNCCRGPEVHTYTKHELNMEVGVRLKLSLLQPVVSV